MGNRDNMVDKTVQAFEESVGHPPNDYELAEIKALVAEEEPDAEDTAG